MMELVVGIAVGVLALIFVAALISLLILIKYKCKKVDLITEQHNKESRQDAHLIIESPDLVVSQSCLDVELGDVQITNPKLEELLSNEQWVDDATGLLPHCLSILKICRNLTEKLVGMTMGNSPNIRTQETLTDIVSIAKRINPRVDEVVQSISPPLDPRLLEARFTALVLSVSQLVMVTKNACHMPGTLDWIDQNLADVEDHLIVLKEASINIETHHQVHAQSTTIEIPSNLLAEATQIMNENSQL
ncbi:transmembrane protein 98-like isoform X2 [Biomphalaria pfeifferi]|uniref:Transmembrane protein 98 n=1 Tax=Biomphalaria pfeifferi TaxID=112525 RepID=A0AAD8F5D6_BIOPF|nr:transmembrane protein 98-like isoform X2 [Biomphalaria pfeifferi]